MTLDKADDMSVAMELRVPRRPEAAGVARRSLEALRDRMPEERFGDLRLLVSELVANSVRHSGPDAGPAVKLRVELRADRVRAEVADRGAPFTLASIPRSAEDEGGRGFEIVRGLADRWGMATDEENRVWFELDRDRAR